MKELVIYCDYDKMDDINYVFRHTGIDIEKITLNTISRYPKIRDYMSTFEYNALKDKFVNYIVFKLEE